MDEPRIKDEVSGIKPIKFEYLETLKLGSPRTIHSKFISVLEHRQSVCAYAPIKTTDLGSFLYHSNRIKKADLSETGHVLYKKNVATPGALGAVHTFLIPPQRNKLYHYDGARHVIGALDQSLDLIHKVTSACREVLPMLANGGWIVWYVADLSVLQSKYENPESLAFRESGGIGATQALVGHALGLGYKQMGISCYELAGELSSERKLIGVGTAVVGAIY